MNSCRNTRLPSIDFTVDGVECPYFGDLEVINARIQWPRNLPRSGERVIVNWRCAYQPSSWGVKTREPIIDYPQCRETGSTQFHRTAASRKAVIPSVVIHTAKSPGSARWVRRK